LALYIGACLYATFCLTTQTLPGVRGYLLTCRYQVQGTNNFFGNWTQTRTILTPMLNHQVPLKLETFPKFGTFLGFYLIV